MAITYEEFLDNLNTGLMEQDFTNYANQFNVPTVYNPELNRLLVNGSPVNLANSGLINQNGKLYGTQQQYLNLINPEYVNPYAAQQQQLTEQMMGMQPYQTPDFMKQFIQDMLARQMQPFEFDLENDPSVIAARQQLETSISEMAAKRGFLYGTAQQDIVAQEFQKLAPMFEEVAYQKEQDFLNRQINLAGVIMQWDQIQADRRMDDMQLIKMKSDFIMQLSRREFEQFTVMLNQRRKDMELELDKQRLFMEQRQLEIDAAYKKIDYLGYADNETAAILGIKPGIKARWAQEAALKQKNELELMKKKHEYDIEMMETNYQIEMDLIKQRSKIELESQLTLMKEEYKYDVALQGQKAQYEMQYAAIRKAQEEEERRKAEAAAKAEAEAKAKETARTDALKAERKYVENMFKAKFCKNGVLKSNLPTTDKDYSYSAEIEAARWLAEQKRAGVSNEVINIIQQTYGVYVQPEAAAEPANIKQMLDPKSAFTTQDDWAARWSGRR